MPIISAGYRGKFTDGDWSRRQPLEGYGRYCVRGANDLQLSNDAATARTVRVSAGTAYGDGILDTLDVATSVSFADAPAGQSVYGAVVLRRDWSVQGDGSYGKTQLLAVNGTSAAQAPPPLNSTAGVLSDQVLGLVQITNGNLSPTLLLGRNCWVEGYRSISSTRNNLQALGGGAQQFLASFDGQAARQGEYRVLGTAVVQGTGSGVADGSLTLTATTGANLADLVGQPVTIDGTRRLFTVEKSHYHLGGPLSAALGLSMPGTWGGGNVLAGAYISATWAGPYP